MTIAYGMTETSPVSTQTRTDDDLERAYGTVGRVAPHLEIKIVDPATGETVQRGEAGEFCTRGYSVMLGYWEDEEKTAEAIDADGWMHTGDLAVMRRRRLRQHHRAGSRTWSSAAGRTSIPREIEEFLYTHPDIEDVQVDRRARREVRRGALRLGQDAGGRRAARRRRPCASSPPASSRTTRSRATSWSSTSSR